MKILLFTGAALIATTAAATAQIFGLTNEILSGAVQLGMVAPDPSMCGVIGGFVLVGIIGARRMRVRS